jgi:hypothetical protein
MGTYECVSIVSVQTIIIQNGREADCCTILSNLECWGDSSLAISTELY